MTSSRSEGFWSANSALGRGYYSYSSSSSSSPPWSSSPPTSPSSSIHPRIAPSSSDSSSRKSSFQWPSHLTTMKSTPVKGPCKLPSFKAMFGDIAPSSSDAESSKGAEHVKSIQELESVFYSDSEEEDENDVGLEDSWTGSTSRTTYFQTSDERGRWHELPPSFRQRHSEPTTTRPLPPSPTKRNLSEPAPLSIPSFTEESSELSYDADLESEPITSDGGVMSSSSPELRPFSSLPPSSPPFSPRSSPTSPDLAPLSPLSSPLSEIMTMSPSIPALSLSPLSAMSPLSSDNDEDVEEMAMQITQALPSSLSPVAPDDPTDNARSIEAPTSPPHSTSNLPWTTPSPPEPRESPITCDAKLPAAIEESDFSVPGSGVIVEPLAIAVKAEIEQPIQSDDVTVFSVKENDAKRKPSEEPSPSPSLPRKKLRTAGPSKPKQGDENSAIPPKRRTRKAPPPLHTAPAKKPAPRRRRRASSFSSSSSSSDSDSDDEAAAPPPAPIPKIVLNTEDMEIFGMIIETMATSRASSLSATSLFKSVMTTRPGLQREWNAEKFVRVLQDAHQQNGVFGKVDSSGMDDSDRPLEAKWFYVPERDEDQDRAALVRSMMPRPAKRTETKKYKQYYYRPLGKISRWDDEDAL